MPLYDLVVMLKSKITNREVIDVMQTAAKRVYADKGVVTNIMSFGKIGLAYEIRKRDGLHKEGRMMQMTVMAPSSFPKDLLYLNKDERLLRWMVVNNCGVKWLRGTTKKTSSI